MDRLYHIWQEAVRRAKNCLTHAKQYLLHGRGAPSEQDMPQNNATGDEHVNPNIHHNTQANAAQSIDIMSSIPSRKNTNVDHEMNDNQKNDTLMEGWRDEDANLSESLPASWYTPPSPAEPAATVTPPGTAERDATEGFKRYSTWEPPLIQTSCTTRASTIGSASSSFSHAASSSSTEAVVGSRFGSYRPHTPEAPSPESVEDTPMSDIPRSPPSILSAPTEPADSVPPPTSAELSIPRQFMRLTLQHEGPLGPRKRDWKILTRQEFQARQQKEAAKALPRRMSLPDTPELQVENDPIMDGRSTAGATIAKGLGSQTGVAITDFAVATNSRVPLDQSAKAAVMAARINEQFKIKKALETRSTMPMDQTSATAQPVRRSQTANSMDGQLAVQQSAAEPQLPLTKDQSSIDQLMLESQLSIEREEEINLRTSIREFQPSMSAFTRVLGPNEEQQAYGMGTSVHPLPSRAANSDDTRPILRHAFICDLCDLPGHRWMNCVNACKRCGQTHKGYLTCTSQYKKRKDDGEGEDNSGFKRMRRGAISE